MTAQDTAQPCSTVTQSLPAHLPFNEEITSDLVQALSAEVSDLQSQARELKFALGRMTAAYLSGRGCLHLRGMMGMAQS